MVVAITSTADPSEASLVENRSILGLRVLVVDDHPGTCELIDVILTEAGAVVASANSSAQAFELLVSHRPDVIISDIEMPTENGYAFLRNLRSVLDEDGGSTPAIALTGRTRPEDRERGLQSGFDLYLTKPASAAALLHAVATVRKR